MSSILTSANTLRRLRLRAILPALLVLNLAACDAEMDDEPAMVSLEIQPMVGTDGLQMGAAHDLGGTKVALSGARVYVSEIALLREDGTEVTFTGETVTAPAKTGTGADAQTITHTVSDRVLLFKHDLGEDTFSLGEAPASTYSGIRLKVGLDGTTNRMDPTAVPASHPLAKQTDLNNHWSWNSGYLFARIDGAVDADGDGVGDAGDDAKVQMHMGMTPLARTVTLNTTFSLTEGAMQKIHLMMDYEKLFDGISYADGSDDQRVCHTMPCMPQATRFADNMQSAFMLHGIHDTDHSGHEM